MTRFPRTAALLAGAMAACGFQPLALWPLALLAIAWLIILVTNAHRGRGAFGLGWFFGVAHFSLGNNWIATAFTFQAEMPVWLGGISVVLLSLYLALWPGFAALAAWRTAGWAARYLDRGAMSPVILGLAMVPAWIVTEWLRGWLFTGFPWNPLGVALLGSFETPGLASLSPWIGTYGLSGLAVALGAGLVAIAELGRRHPLAASAALVAPALLLALAMTRPASWIAREEGAIRFTLVQPYLTQDRIDDVSQFEPNFLELAALTVDREPVHRIVFWPESGLGDYIREGLPNRMYRMFTYRGDPRASRERIGRIVGPYAMLLTGAVDLEMDEGRAVAARNTVTAISGKGTITASYSKAHLVPFGEYLPLRGLLEPLGLSRLVAGSLDFWPGPGPQSFDFGRYGKAGVQICYEIVFSGAVVDPADRPDYIFNPSNDGWFGAWGPPQHLAQARLRAIEEGLPVLRATTTGISAVIDADGVVRAHVPHGRAGRIDSRIPPPHAPTLFSRLGNSLPLGLALAWTIIWMLALVAATKVASRRPVR